VILEILMVFNCIIMYQLTGINKVDKRSEEEILREKLLQILESAYPNVLEVEDLTR
jgi:hypothetical protein